VDIAAAAPPIHVAGPWWLAWRRLRRDRVSVASGIFLIALTVAVFAGAPIAARALGHGPNDPFPYAVNLSLKPASPWAHIPDTNRLGPVTSELELPPPPKGTGETLFVLGGDGALGRDLFLRVLYGGQVSLEVGLGATLVALVIGVLLGVTAGWLGGFVDGAISRLTDLVMALPILLLLLMVGTGLGSGLDHVTFHGLLNVGVLQLILLIGCFTWYYPARIVRSQMLSLRNREFVEAAGMIGASGPRIVRKHLVPHLIPSLAAYGTLMVATNIMLEIGVTFLGAGIQLPTSSWGSLLAQTWGSVLGLNPITPANFQPWPTVVPSIAIFLTVLSLNQLGEGLREALDPAGVP
jgi:peptide/nickel transport system permease protein